MTLRKTQQVNQLSLLTAAKTKQFIAIFLPMLLVLGGILSFSYNYEARTDLAAFGFQEVRSVDLLQATIAGDLHLIGSDLAFLADITERIHLQRSANETEELRELAWEFLWLCQRKGIYDQIRFLSDSGMEIVRVNLGDGQSYIVPEGELQDKHDRYYFNDTFRLNPGEIYLSPLDLNVEDGAVEIPLKPMIRFGTPVVDGSGRKNGIVVLNYLATILIDKLEVLGAGAPGPVMLLNPEGYWLKGASPEDEWGFMFEEKRDITFAARYPEVWQQIMEGESGQIRSQAGLFTYETVYPLQEGIFSSSGFGEPSGQSERSLSWQEYHWKLISFVSSDILHTNMNDLRNRYGILAAMLVLLTGAISWSLATGKVKRKQAEDALHESEERYRTLFEESVDAVYFSTPDGKFIDINPAGVELFGYSSKEEILDINIADSLYFNPQDRRDYQLAITQQGYIKDFELILKTKSDEKVIVLETASAIHDDDGNIVMYWGILRDITGQRQLEQQLLQSQKMEAVGRLAGGIAHDFNNALTVILGNTDLVLSRQSDGNPPNTNLLGVRKAATHAAELTHQLLAFSRKQIVDPRILEVNAVISGIQGMLQRVIGEDIKLITSFSADVGNIRMDPGQVEQVIMNLVVNARQAMPRGGTITIETEQVELDETYIQTHLYAKPGQYAQISVSDTGIGMSEEIQEHLFEPFYTTKETGTGLGMATVYGIVKQNNGSINVYSEEGTGTTFKIYLPITSEHPDAFPSAADGSGLTGGTETILVVEDDDAVRELTIDILTDLGYQVHAFSNVEEALDHTRSGEEPADLLLTDVVMPGMDGAELAEAVVKERPSIRVLYMSGYTSNAIATHGVLDEGINLLQKPFTQADIARKIRKVLDADQTG